MLGGGTYTGNIVNSGTITIEGNQSAGIAIDSALTGSLTNTGTITVLGNDSFGIRAGAVNGNVTLTSGSDHGAGRQFGRRAARRQRRRRASSSRAR